MIKSYLRRVRNAALVTSSIVPMLVAQTAAATQLGPNDNNTVSPIKHVIVIIGENRTFDHVFGTYVPKQGQSVLNILSEGIVTIDGKPGPNFSKVTAFGQPVQMKASDTDYYKIAPGGKTPYATLPPPGAAGSPTNSSDTDPPPFASLLAAANYEYGLYPGDLALITTGASGLSGTHVPDSRILHDSDLPNGPFQLTGPSMGYDSYTGSPVHRFYQMWQQMDCDISHATATNPTGCLADLFPWVETTVDAGSNGAKPAASYNPATYQSAEGATAMGFFNMAKGDVSYFKQLADTYAISDNFHQSVMGGTGANHIEFGFADGIYYSDAQGQPATPPAGQIENPNPQKGTNNYWINDGYGSYSTNEGGSYTNCKDETQPGVHQVDRYLRSIKVDPNCEPNAYYLVNNYNPAYVGNGTLDPTDNGPYTITPVTRRHIGDNLNAGEISWAYFGESWNDYVVDPNGETNPAGYLYCNICNPFQYSTQTMTNEQQRLTHIQDTLDLYNDIANGDLPAVSIVKPNGLNDGHPASSKLDLFESFTHKIIAELKANPSLWATTAVFITFDEGGGYWDSGYVQPVDFRGDGTRIPLIVVSPYAEGGKVAHNYSDHVSIDKFIERNWKLKPITDRSRDNLPNPVATDAYVPTNRPAISDLFELFNFN
jgi:phospholipase C